MDRMIGVSTTNRKGGRVWLGEVLAPSKGTLVAGVLMPLALGKPSELSEDLNVPFGVPDDETAHYCINKCYMDLDARVTHIEVSTTIRQPPMRKPQSK